eukprot:scaffold4099_cov53-Attheya_sp.AAC.1
MEAQRQGMKQAGTRQSEENTVRKNSYLTWLSNTPDENCDDAEEEDDIESTSFMARTTASSMTNLAKTLFVHESLGAAKISSASCHEHFEHYCAEEELQIVKYDSGGSFDLHHDGYERFLTVLTYLNGVGGTWFPMAQTSEEQKSILTDVPSKKADMEKICADKVAGRDGLLIVGKECNDPPSNSDMSLDGNDDSSRSIVRIQAGDAIAFYNHRCGQPSVEDSDEECTNSNEEWRTLHCGLHVDQQKWIATNWFRSKHLTGPHAQLYRQRLLEMKQR